MLFSKDLKQRQIYHICCDTFDTDIVLMIGFHEIKQNSILCCAYYWATKSSIPRASYTVCCMTKLSGDSLYPNRHDTAAGDDCAYDTLADYVFRFKMDIPCICKYFWRLSLCHFFQTDVRLLKEFGNWTDAFFNSCFMSVICLWSLGATTIRKAFFATFSFAVHFIRGVMSLLLRRAT